MAIKKSKKILSLLLIAVMAFSMYVALPDTVDAAATVTQMVSSGCDNSFALKSDGTVWAWGINTGGQLGDGTSGADKNSPVQIKGLTGIIAIASGRYHTLALKSDGTVWAWGANFGGQLGDDTTINKSSPVEVSELTGVIAIAGGGNHSLALKSDGTVWTWGYNNNGQLGNGTSGDGKDKSSPEQITGLSEVTNIAGGLDYSLAIKNDGTVWAWGNNEYGQLGDGTNTDSNSPVKVTGLTDMTAIAGGYGHSLALKDDGTVWTWGYNIYEQLGDNTNTDRNSPVMVSGLSDVISIAGAYYHSFALKSDGTIRAWGNNAYGQLGNGTNSDRSNPVQVSGLTNVISIAGGFAHSLAIKSDDTIWAWGRNNFGQLGNGSFVDENSPGQVKGKEGSKTPDSGATYKVTAVKTLPAVYIVKGKSVTLPAAVQPYNAANKNVTFKSKNKKIAKVTSTGKIKGLKTGKTTITITTKDGNKKATCKVYVVKKAVKLKKLTLNQKANVTLTKGKTLEVKAKLSPKKATGIVPKFTSGNTSVAVIDKAGTITALKAGTTTITVKAGKLKKTIKLTVN